MQVPLVLRYHKLTSTRIAYCVVADYVSTVTTHPWVHSALKEAGGESGCPIQSKVSFSHARQIHFITFKPHSRTSLLLQAFDDEPYQEMAVRRWQWASMRSADTGNECLQGAQTLSVLRLWLMTVPPII